MTLKQKFFFDHIIKAGGTSVDRAFALCFGEDNITHGLVNEPLSSALKHYADKMLITGHFKFLPHEKLDPDRYSITMLRHPVDRVLSLYYFLKNNVRSGHDYVWALTKSMSLSEFLNSPILEIRRDITNYQTMHYSTLEWDGGSVLSDDLHLALAKKSLLQYDLVGVFHEFEDYFDVLACNTGFPLLKQVPKVNVTQNRPRLSELDPAVLARIEELNRLDIELYQFATELFHQQRRDVLRRYATALPPMIAPTDVGGRTLRPRTGTPNPEPAEFGSRELTLRSVTVTGEVSLGQIMCCGEFVTLRVGFHADVAVTDLVITIRIFDSDDHITFGTNTRELGKNITVGHPGDYYVDFRFRCDLGQGTYRVSAALHRSSHLEEQYYHWKDDMVRLRVAGNIGYNFMGATKLYATLEGGASSNGSLQQLILDDLGLDWPRFRKAGVINPILVDPNATIIILSAPGEILRNEIIIIEIEITNNGDEKWEFFGERKVCISYHWLDAENNIYIFDGTRTELPRDLDPNETIRVWVTVNAPDKSDNYTLSILSVQECVAWHEELAVSCQVRIR